MTHARFITTWVYAEDTETNEPKLSLDVNFVGQVTPKPDIPPEAVPPLPNITIIEVSPCSNGNLNSVIQHPDHGNRCILYTHDTDDQIMSTADFEVLHDYLIVLGMSSSQVAAAIGTAPNGRARFTIANALKVWLEANY